MERPEIIEILIESLHSPPDREQRVAYAFLRDIAARRGEPLTHRMRATLHLALYRIRKCTAYAAGSVRSTGLIVRRVPRLARTLLLSSRDTVINGIQWFRLALLVILIVATNGCFSVRAAASSYASGILAAIVTARAAVIDVLAGLLSVFVSLVRKSYGAVAAVCAAIVNAVRTSFLLALFTLAGAYAACGRAVYAVYAGVIGIAVSLYVLIRDTAVFLVLSAAFGIAYTITAVEAGYAGTRDAILLTASRISARILKAYRFAHFVSSEIKRHAIRQVLPQGTTPFIAAGLVCLVLFVFGINSYFVISDTNKKGIFIDLSRYEWGDEALASILIGEGYDIYLNEKITEKRIKELLSSGQYYERIIRVTGYYSPLPDQNKYATGSYRGDIILNGRGIMGSDTTPVYIGMAAGPPHMEFGTNVIIEDLGKFNLPKIYTVHDRGGAIKGNRLDIWVGKGEEAMEKAYEITGYYKVIVVGDK